MGVSKNHLNFWANKHILRVLMIVPPILFLAYMTHGLITIRGLLGQSSRFHQDFANDLVQDYLALDLAMEEQSLKYRLVTGQSFAELKLLGLEANGEPWGYIDSEEGKVAIFLKRETLAENLNDFFRSSKGLTSLFAEHYHQPVYWFQVVDGDGEVFFSSGRKPDATKVMVTYPMDRSLKGYTLQVVYSSFGPSQLYTVARTQFNFGGLLLLFVLAVFSGGLLTLSIRQKIVLARQKSFFVSTVSHEFKTPLAIMRLAAETLAAKRFKKPEEETRFQNMLTTEINRLDLLVQKILSFTKIEMGQVHYHPTEIDLRDSLRVTLTIFEAQAKAEKVNLEVEIDERPCHIFGDGDMIRHAIDNVLDNAFKYRGASDRILFSCICFEEEVVVSVTDFGIGIPEDEIPHLHKSFYRVHDPALQGVRGSGLGLAITRSILAHSDALLEIKSVHGKGSTFVIRFPRFRKDR